MKSPVVQRLDQFQERLTAFLEPLGFRKSGRAYNRPAEEGIVQVITIQAGPYEIGEPLPESVAHLRPNLYGKFTINLGVFVPEAHDRSHPKRPRTIQEYHCEIRARFSDLKAYCDDWWSVHAPLDTTIEEVTELLDVIGLPFMNRFSTRESIVNGWIEFNENELRLTNTARLGVAMILLKKEDRVGAKRLFEERVRRSTHRGHQELVRAQAINLGLGELAA